MLFAGILPGIMANSVKALHEHHHGRHTSSCHFGGIMQWAGWQLMHLTASLPNGFIGLGNQSRMKRPGRNLLQTFPGHGDTAFVGEAFTGGPGVCQHTRQDRRIEMPLVQGKAAFRHDAGDDAGLGRAGADGADAAKKGAGGGVDASEKPVRAATAAFRINP